MVEIADIKDSDRLLRWLKEQPNDVSVWITCRAAMRLLPDWWHFVRASDDGNKRGLTALPILRCNLIAAVARSMPVGDIKYVATEAADAANVMANAAGAASSAAYAAANSANASADESLIAAPAVAAYAANAVAYTAAYDVNIWPLIRADCRAFLAGDDLDQLPLWGDQANPYADVWAEIKQQLTASSPSRSDDAVHGAVDWSFWIKWYDDALEGNTPNWEMLERIALIYPEEWDKGAEVVNPLIAEIEKEFAVQATPYAEEITYDGQYHSQPRSDLPAQTLEDARARIGDVVEALRKVGNQYPELGDEADFLARMLERYPERAIRLFEACQKVIIHMGNHQVAGAVPPDGNLVGDVIGDLQNTADDIYSFDPEVQQVLDARDARRFERLSETQREDVARVAEAVAQNSDADLAEEMREDAAEISGEDDPEGETKPARYRLGSRLVRVVVMGGAGVGVVLGTLAAVEPAVLGAQYLWQIIRPLIGF